jgi:hypothetical protein
MASNIRIELISAGVSELLKAKSVADLERRTSAIAAAATANAGGNAVFGHDVVIGRNRAHGMVWADNFEAKHAEATTRALTRAIDAGRG